MTPPRSYLNLLLLDPMLEKENGIQLAEHLRRNGYDIPVIFITNRIDFALTGCSAKSLSYLLKPLDRKNIMVIDTPSQTISFRLDEVLYIDIYDKTLSVHMQNGTVLKAMANLNSLLKKLPQEQFIQCHRSYIVSLSAISSLCRYTIELKNREMIPVSKKRYKDVQNALVTFFAS